MFMATASATGDTGIATRHNVRRDRSMFMTTLLQIDFPTVGPFGAEMSKAYADLAASIATEPGLLRKL